MNSLLNTPLAADMNVYAKFKHSECSYTQETVVAPTCTEVGYTLLKCECGEGEKTKYVLTTEHTFSEWRVKKDATQTEDGLKERICTVCGEIETMTIKYNGLLVFNPTPPITYRVHCHCCVDHNHCTCCDNVYNCLIKIDPDFSVTEILPADEPDIQYNNVMLNPEDKVYSVTLDKLPDDFCDNYDKYMYEIAGNISDYVADDSIINADDFKIDIYIKDESGENHPVTLPSFPSEPDTPELETEDNLVTNNSDKFVP